MAARRGNLRRAIRWVIGSVLVTAVVVGVAWWLQGKLIWQDAGGAKLGKAGAKVRSVLWGVPAALPAPINTSGDEYEPALSGDGTELYFVRGRSGKDAEIYVSNRRGGEWTTPLPLADVNTPYDELGPKLSGDGRWLYFYSDRPGGEGAFDIWASRRTEGGWEKPVNLGPSVNTPYNEFSPAPTPDGKRIYFASNRKHQPKRNHGTQWAGTLRQNESGDYDLYAAAAIEATTRTAAPSFAPAAEMSAANTAVHEGACAAAPSGDFLYFTSNRDGGSGELDLWRARIGSDGALSVPENLGTSVNSARNESDPFPAVAGFRVYFSSDREKAGGYDLFVSDSREVFAGHEARPLPEFNASIVVLALGVVSMGFLLTMVRSSGSRDLLTKCLLFSLLLHAALASGFSAVTVSRHVRDYVREQEGMEVPINLEASRLAELQLQLRNQITDLAAPPPEAPAEKPALASDLTWSAPQSVAVLPTPRTAAPMVSLRPIDVSVARPEAVDAPVAPLRPAVSLRLPSAPPKVPELVKAPELRPQVNVPSIEAPRVEPRMSVVPMEVRAPDLPVRADVRSMARAMEMPVRPPVVDAKIALPPTVSGPELKLPTLSGTKLAGTDSPSPAAPLGARLEAAAPRLGPTIPMLRPPAVTVGAPAGSNLGAGPRVPLHTPGGVAVAVAPPATSIGELRIGIPQNRPAVDGGDEPAPFNPRQPARTPPMIRADIEGPTAVNPLPRALRSDDIIVSRPPPKPAFPELSLRPPPAPLQAPPRNPLLPVNVGVPKVDLSRVTPDLIARDPEIRRAMIEEMGGSAATESAVEMALAYLARNQQQDGRWIIYDGERSPRRSREQTHDPAMTGLAVLCFLAANHRPDLDGPYQKTVDRALKYLLFVRERNGNVRGDGGNMYDQAIGTLALAEAALMTRDPKLKAAALSAAGYIIEAQDRTGGWRYLPDGGSDLSVTGWQVMALHSAENLGFVVPPRAKQSALRWVDSVTSGKHGGLAAYMNDRGPTESMTAQGILSRILLDQKLTAEQIGEAGAFLTKTPPAKLERDYYQFYCTSLVLMQLQTEAWKRWNPLARDLLLATQRKTGDAAGSWDLDEKWAPEGGRVYSTALATLTLEVYYRYLPMYAHQRSW